MGGDHHTWAEVHLPDDVEPELENTSLDLEQTNGSNPRSYHGVAMRAILDQEDCSPGAPRGRRKMEKAGIFPGLRPGVMV